MPVQGIPLPGRTIPSTAAHHDAAAASLASRDGSQNNLAVIQAGSTFPADAASVGPGAGVGVGVGQVAASPSAKDASSIQPPSSHGAAARGGEGSAGRDGGGVYVLGLIRGLAGDAAGIEQGDEVVAVGGRDVGGRTPFEVASILAGAEEAGEEPPGSSRADLFGQTSQKVVLQVGRLPVLMPHHERQRMGGSRCGATWGCPGMKGVHLAASHASAALISGQDRAGKMHAGVPVMTEPVACAGAEVQQWGCGGCRGGATCASHPLPGHCQVGEAGRRQVLASILICHKQRGQCQQQRGRSSSGRRWQHRQQQAAGR